MRNLAAKLCWVLVVLVGIFAYATLAVRRGEEINSVYILIAALCSYAIGYRFYSKWIAARVLMLDDRRATPCEVHDDGKDFVKTNKWIVFGHHFAAIAGPGPLVGPTLAAQFGYLPGAIWIVIGAVLGGCVQDFVILFASMRRDGKSLGEMAKEEVGGSRLRKRGEAQDSPLGRLCRLQRHRSQIGIIHQNLPQLQRRGTLRFQQGFFSVSRPCGQCNGAGQIVTEPCPVCQGRQRVYKEPTIAVHIPAGIETGMRLRLSNEGGHGANSGPPGDLYVAITVKPHPVFQRKGLDILCDVPINLVTAVLGGKVEVPTLKRDTIIKVPPGTQQDKVLKIKGLGIPSLKGGATGDHLYTIKIQIPTKLTARQKELLTEFAKEGGMSTEADGNGFFDKMKTFFE